MGGRQDTRLATVTAVAGNRDLMEAAPLEGVARLLDVGMGAGEAARYFASRGVAVAGIGLHLEQYGTTRAEFAAEGIETHECSVLDMPFEAETFDAVWMSHVLEHCLNPGLALEAVRRVLKPRGWLFVCVPPHKSRIVGGHVATGWSVGQLMYVLIVCGFEARGGHFIRHGYNVCAFVRRSEEPLPPLTHDRPDIELLRDRFPMPVEQGFEGDLERVNWIGFADPALDRPPSAFARLKRRVRAAWRALRR